MAKIGRNSSYVYVPQFLRDIRKECTHMKKRFLSTLMALCLALSLLPATALAADTTVSSEEALKAAIENASVGDTITLGDSFRVVGDNLDGVITIDSNKEITLNLGGYTLTACLHVDGAQVTIKNGTIKAPASGAYLNATPVYIHGSSDESAEEDYSVLNVESDVVLDGTGGYGMLVSGQKYSDNNAYGAEISIAGKMEGPLFISGTIGATTALSSSGKPIVINIEGGADLNDTLIMNGETTVNVYEGATITGDDAVAVKRGTLNIYGGTFEAIGEKVDPAVANHNGSETTGSAISVTSTYNNTTHTGIDVNIKGGTFISKNNAAVYVGHSRDDVTVEGYKGSVDVTIENGSFTGGANVDAIYIAEKDTADTGLSGTLVVDGAITGGTFSSGVAKYVAGNNYSVGQENGTFTVDNSEPGTGITDDAGNYYVSKKAAQAGSTASVTTEEGTTSYYTSLSAAIADATSGNTIDLWKDVTASNTGLNAYTDAVYELPAGVTLDGHGKRIVADAENWTQISGKDTSNHILSVESGSDKTTIKNLTIIGVNESGKASKAGIHAYDGAIVDITNVTIGGCGSVGVQVNGATVTATDLNVSGSGWGSVNVDKGSTSVAPNFTFNSGNLEDDVQIYSENPPETQIEVKDSSYQKVQGGDGDLVDKVYYTTDPAKLGEATVTKAGVTTVYTDLDNALSSENAPSGSTVTVVKNATLDNDATIVSGVTFVVDDGVRLTIANEKTLTNNGTIVNNGTITGTVTTEGSGKATAQVTFVTTPSNATVTVTGQGSGKTYDLPDGTYSYTVSANGCYSKTGSFTVSRNAQTITVKLEQIPTSSSGGSSSSEPSYSPVMDVSKGGSVKVNPRTPGEGDEVTITVDPDAGYEVDEVIVTDRSGRDVRVTAERDGTYTFEQPKGRVTIAVTFVREGTSTFFADVAETYWAYDEIAWAYENGYVNGVTATTFAPGASISRQQIWMILARIAGDGPADMAAARQWSIDNGISDGTNPGSAVTRQQLAALLFRFAELMGLDTTAGGMAIREFPDYEAVASYAAEAMDWAVSAGIINGTTDGTLNPTGTATRAQFAVMLYRFWTGV